jgi:histidyl-tRNA synthetase
MGGGSFKSQMKRADRSGAALAVIIGDDEAARGTAAIKALRAATDQQECAFGDLPARLAQLLRGS